MDFAVRDIFSAVTLEQIECDWPVTVRDPATGIDITHRSEPHTSGSLTFSGGLLGAGTIRTACAPDDINLIATLLLDGIKCQLG